MNNQKSIQIMEKSLFQEHPESQRAQMLADNADAIESISYTKRFTHEELTDFKHLLSEIAIELDAIEFEKKQIMDKLKTKLKPISEAHKDLLNKIRNKAELIEESCYKMVDEQNDQVGYYNEAGELVYQRPIMPNEKQKTIFSINRNAANG